MKKEYQIKGIDRILKTVSREDLARSFETKQDANFGLLITENLKEMGVPSGLEIAGYEARNYEDIKEGMNGYLSELCDKYIKDGKAAIGINYPLTEKDITELYFYIDEPIKNEELSKMWTTKTHLGGVMTLGHTMGKGFYEAHKDEIEKFQKEFSKSFDDERDFDDYVRDYFDRLSGKKENKYVSDWENEQQEKRMKEAEKLIYALTDKKSIEDVTLQDLEQIKKGLKVRQEKVIEEFTQKFDTKKVQTKE